MKLQIQREDLLEPLQQIMGAIEKRQTMPVLSNVLIKTTSDSLSLTATDLEIELLCQRRIAIDVPGEVTIPARKLLDICKALPADAQINIEVKADKAIVKSGRSRFSLATLSATDFPSLDDINSHSEFEMSQATLKNIIDKTAFAMAQQDVRYYLNGLMLEISSKILRAVATDGHRLAYCEKAIDCELPDIKQVILPRKGVLELARMLKDTDDHVKISMGSNHLRAEMDHFRFTSKLIDGRFPDYNRVIPSDGHCIMSSDREVLRQALIRASILSNEKYRGIRLILNENLIRLQAQNPDHEEADVELEVNYSNSDIEVGFNVNYMIDVLNVSDSSTVQATLKDSNSSCLLTFPDQEDCKYVVMPMRL
jgi:DNA polymerase-3 subunit beta